MKYPIPNVQLTSAIVEESTIHVVLRNHDAIVICQPISQNQLTTRSLFRIRFIPVGYISTTVQSKYFLVL